MYANHVSRGCEAECFTTAASSLPKLELPTLVSLDLCGSANSCFSRAGAKAALSLGGNSTAKCRSTPQGCAPAEYDTVVRLQAGTVCVHRPILHSTVPHGLDLLRRCQMLPARGSKARARARAHKHTHAVLCLVRVSFDSAH